MNKRTAIYRLKVSKTAKMVALEMLASLVTKTAELAEIMGLGGSTVRRAKAELRAVGWKLKTLKSERSKVSAAPLGSERSKRSKVSALARAYKESTLQVDTSCEESDSKKAGTEDSNQLRAGSSRELVSVAPSFLSAQGSVAPAPVIFENTVQLDPLHGMLATVAGWYDPAWLPEARWTRARSTVARMIALHGSPVVLKAVGDLAAQIDGGVAVLHPVIVLEKVCQRLKATPAKAPPEPPWVVEKRRRGLHFLALAEGDPAAWAKERQQDAEVGA